MGIFSNGRDGGVARVLASHHWARDDRDDVLICGLSLSLVLVLTLNRFSTGTQVVSSCVFVLSRCP